MNENNKGRIIIKKKALAVILVLTLFIGGLVGGLVTYTGMMQSTKYKVVNGESYDKLVYVYNKYAKLDSLYNSLKGSYYSELDDEKLMNGIYKGLFAATEDPYTVYYTADEYKAMFEKSTGEFYGIGISMTSTEDNKILIVNVFDDTPAEDAGVKVGDLVIAVDGQKYSGDELSDATEAMRGQLNTNVKVTFSRNGREYSKIITRKKIDIPSVYSTILEDENIGYIYITAFMANTAADFKTELRDMESKKVDGLIIDLRGNGGGMTSAGYEIADLLLPECTVTILEDNQGKRTYINSDASHTSLEYVILVNGGTASTSEILTAAVKDNKGGKIIGTQTYGKGITQASSMLNDQSGGVKITTQQYYSPNGDIINKTGIEPDIVVEFKASDTTDVQFEKAIEILTK